MTGFRLTLASLCLVWAGCGCGPSQTPCGSDSDCTPDQFCGPSGFCVENDGGADGGGADGGCAVQCASYQICTNGACLSLYTSIQITSPLQSAFVPAAVEFDAVLNVVACMPRNDPPTLNYSAQPASGAAETGTLALLGDGTYQSTWMPAQEGLYTLVVSYPAAGIQSMPITISVLKTPPTFQIQVPASPRDGGFAADPAPGYGAAWRRNEIVTVNVSSTDPDVDIGSAQILVLGVAGDDAGAPGPVVPVMAATGCGVPTCGTAAIDLSQPQFDAFRGMVGLSLLAQDFAMNPGTATASIPVTRWEWAFDAGAPLAGGPAIGHFGTLYAATAAGGLVAVGPDGVQRWALDAGTIQTTVSVGANDAGDVLYAALASTGGSASLAALDGTSGAVLASCPVAAGAAAGGVAVFSTTVLGQSLESAVAVFDATPSTSELVALRRGAPVANQCVAAVGVPSIVAGGTLVADGQGDVFYSDTSGTLQAFAFDGGWPVAPSWSAGPYGARALALAAGDLVGTGGLGPSGVFAEPTTGGSLAWSYWDGGAAAGLDPVVADGGVVFYGDQSGALTSVAVGTSAPLAAVALPAPISSQPILGQGGFLYTVDSAGNVTASDLGLTAHWTLAGTQPGALAFDCPRDASGATSPRPSILYVASGDGTLYAFITDSIGADFNASWPKYQHDPRNTANASTSLVEFRCF